MTITLFVLGNNGAGKSTAIEGYRMPGRLPGVTYSIGLSPFAALRVWLVGQGDPSLRSG